MCIFSSHSSNSYLTSHETLIPNNHCVWMKKGSYSWAFSFFLVLDLILLIVLMHCLVLCIICHIFMHFLYLAFLYLHCLVLILLLCFSFVWVKKKKKIQNHIKSEKFKKFDCICLSTCLMWVWPCTFVQMTLCIYELSLFFLHLYLCGKNLDIFVWLL